MRRQHRIAAGGLVFREDAVLLVRYRDGEAGTFLVGPGGALEDQENVPQAIVRETAEETGITVRPIRVVLIEDLLCTSFKMIKVWMTCDWVAGEVAQGTQEAEAEGIIGVDWFTRPQLGGEVVYPSPLMQFDWAVLRSDSWPALCLPSRSAGF